MTTKILEIETIVGRALAEDVGSGDVTSSAILVENNVWHGHFLAKGEGVAAGLQVAAMTFRLLDERVQFSALVEDGDQVTTGAVLAEASGPGQALLGAERVALNFLQRMSGIATMTRQYVTAVAGAGAIIL
ncbi:MAG: nicotinate-nucleotide diphosphorylase, partial [Anaerolineae bacterium]